MVYLRLEPEKIDTIDGMPTQPLFVDGWEVAGIKSAEKFFLALRGILPFPVTLYFEGTSMSPDVLALFASNAVTPTLEIPIGTIWPKPSVFHVRATEQFLQELATLAGKYAEPEVCNHFHAYSSNHGLMQWYDAFSGDPLLIGESVPEAEVQSLCRQLEVKYTRWRAPIARK